MILNKAGKKPIILILVLVLVITIAIKLNNINSIDITKIINPIPVKFEPSELTYYIVETPSDTITLVSGTLYFKENTTISIGTDKNISYVSTFNVNGEHRHTSIFYITVTKLTVVNVLFNLSQYQLFADYIKFFGINVTSFDTSQYGGMWDDVRYFNWTRFVTIDSFVNQCILFNITEVTYSYYGLEYYYGQFKAVYLDQIFYLPVTEYQMFVGE